MAFMSPDIYQPMEPARFLGRRGIMGGRRGGRNLGIPSSQGIQQSGGLNYAPSQPMSQFSQFSPLARPGLGSARPGIVSYGPGNPSPYWSQGYDPGMDAFPMRSSGPRFMRNPRSFFANQGPYNLSLPQPRNFEPDYTSNLYNSYISA